MIEDFKNVLVDEILYNKDLYDFSSIIYNNRDRELCKHKRFAIDPYIRELIKNRLGTKEYEKMMED